jgi:NDP-sugar pyrophosphorylase family protein
MIQGVILAGGLGTRLRPVTETVPKPMVPVAGKPFLHHQLAMLAKNGFTRVLLLTGYLGEQVQAHFGDGRALGLELSYEQEPAPLGTGGAVRRVLHRLEDRFVLMFGDSLLPIDYRDFAAVFQRSDADGLMAIYADPSGATDVPGNVELGQDGRVLRYDKGAGLHWIEAGVLAFRRTAIESLPPNEACSLEHRLYPTLIAAGRLQAYPTHQRFYDIGTPERLRQFQETLT